MTPKDNPMAKILGLPSSAPRFVATKRPQSFSEQAKTEVVFGARTYGDIARMVGDKLSKKRQIPS